MSDSHRDAGSRGHTEDPLLTVLFDTHEAVGRAVAQGRGRSADGTDDARIDAVLAGVHDAVGRAVARRHVHPTADVDVPATGDHRDATVDDRDATGDDRDTVGAVLAGWPPATRLVLRPHLLGLAGRLGGARDLARTCAMNMGRTHARGRVLRGVRLVAADLDSAESALLALGADRRRVSASIDHLAAAIADLSGRAHRLAWNLVVDRPLVFAADLTPVRQHARTLATGLDRAVSDLRAAGTEFQGADVHAVDLTDVMLEGVRWDLATHWPADWEERIRWASDPDGDGVFVVRSQPLDTATDVIPVR